MIIGVIADIHLGYGDTSTVLSALKATVTQFNEEVTPDHVVVLGDLIEDGPGHDQDLVNYRQAVTALSELSAPITYVLGNHDVMNLSYDDIESITDQLPWGQVEQRNILYLDSSAPRLRDPRGEVGPDQLAYLDEKLASLDHVILFVHHPIHYHDIRTNDWFADQPEHAFCGNKADIQRVLDRHDTDIAVINGHLHETDYTRYRGVDHFTINAFNKTRPNGGVTSTYGVLSVTTSLTMRVTDNSGMAWTLELPYSA